MLFESKNGLPPGLEDDQFHLALRLDPNDFACADFHDPESFAHTCTGEIIFMGYSGQVRAVIGRFGVIQVDADGAIVQRVSVFDVFDCSSTTFPYFEALYTRHDSFKEKVLKALDCENEYVTSGLLILDRLEIAPPYRGRGYGIKALRCLIQRFRMGAGLIAMKPFPLQFEGKALDLSPTDLEARGLARFTRNERVATAKLCRYYGQLGFKKIPRTPFIALSTVYPLTSR